MKLIRFNKLLHEDTMVHHKYGQKGSPWEFNLRDVIRSCQIIDGMYLYGMGLYSANMNIKLYTYF